MRLNSSVNKYCVLGIYINPYFGIGQMVSTSDVCVMFFLPVGVSWEQWYTEKVSDLTGVTANNSALRKEENKLRKLRT